MTQTHNGCRAPGPQNFSIGQLGNGLWNLNEVHRVGLTVGHLWSYPSIFFIGIPARTGHALTGENVVSFSEVLRFW